MHLKTIPMNDHLRIECLTLACAALDIVGPDRPLTRVNRAILEVCKTQDNGLRRFWCAELQCALAEMTEHAMALEAELGV